MNYLDCHKRRENLEQKDYNTYYKVKISEKFLKLHTKSFSDLLENAIDFKMKIYAPLIFLQMILQEKFLKTLIISLNLY